jgi:hypothetical protein
VIILLLLATGGYLLFANRHYLAFVAGLDSNRHRIEGDWFEVRDGFTEDDVYTFSDGIILKNEDTHGSYHFTSHSVLVISTGRRPVTYTIRFPDSNNMQWYREVKGEQTLSRIWTR